MASVVENFDPSTHPNLSSFGLTLLSSVVQWFSIIELRKIPPPKKQCYIILHMSFNSEIKILKQLARNIQISHKYEDTDDKKTHTLLKVNLIKFFRTSCLFILGLAIK